MRIALVFLLLLTCQVGDSQLEKPNNSIQKYADQIKKYETIRHAPFSFYVKDLTSNSVIADINGQMSIPAASTMKLVTTATALKILGSKHRFKTKLTYSGYIDTNENKLYGNLYIIGGGDPTLGSKYYNKPEEVDTFLYKWADRIKKLGIHSIEGQIIADGSVYRYNGVPSGWVWGDMGNYYGAGPNGLTIYDNLIKLKFQTGKLNSKAKLTCIIPYIPYLTIKSSVKAAKSRRDNAYVFGAPYSSDWFVSGSLPMHKDDFTVKAANPDPELTFAIAFDHVLNQSGIYTKYAPL